jgi:hypothetical protein
MVMGRAMLYKLVLGVLQRQLAANFQLQYQSLLFFVTV